MKKILPLAALLLSTQVFASLWVEPLAESTCQKEYLDLFSKDTVTMTVVFGYFDADTTYTDKKTGKVLYTKKKTMDANGRKQFINKLTGKCSNWDERMCDFKIIQKGSPWILSRKMFGPDGKIKTVLIKTESSSVSTNDDANRENPLQVTRTKLMKDLFKDGLMNSEITVYQGHSRDGGGPSFEPPVLLSNKKVDYDYYHKHKADKNFMISTLKQDPNKSRILALVSCNSIRWFSKSIQANSAATGIIGTTSDFYTNDFSQSISWMEDLFSYKCLKDIDVDDANKVAKIVSPKSVRVSRKIKTLTDAQVDIQTLEALASSLRSPDPSVRRAAYNEIQAYSPELYSERVRNELKAYTFGNTLKANL